MSQVVRKDELNEMRDELLRRFATVRKRLRQHFVADGLARALGAMAALLIVSVLLDWTLELSLIARIAYWLVIAAGVGYIVYRYLVQPWRLPLGPVDIAAAIDQKRHTKHDEKHDALVTRVAGVLQLANASSSPTNDSVALAREAVHRNYQALQSEDLHEALDEEHFWKRITLGFFAVAIPLALAWLYPSTAQLWASRWLAGSDAPWPRSTQITVEGLKDGRLIVPRGETFTLKVTTESSKRLSDTARLRIRGESVKTQTIPMERFAEGDFRLEMAPLQQPIRVDLWSGDGRVPTFVIDPRDRPRVIDWKLTHQGPRDREPQVTDMTTATGAAQVSLTTKVQLDLVANTPCDSVKVETDAKSVPLLTFLTPTTLTTRWEHSEPVSLRVVLTSSESGLSSNPQPISVGVTPDRPPRSQVRHSGVRLRVTPVATIPLTIAASDDYALTSVELHVAAKAKAAPAPESAEDKEETKGKNAASPSGNEPDQNPEDDTSKPLDAAQKPDEAKSEETKADETKADEAQPTESAKAATDPKADSEEPKPAEASQRSAEPARAPALQEKTITIFDHKTSQAQPKVDTETKIDLSEYALEPGRTFSLFTSATDDCPLGVQSAKSQVITFTIVTPEELFKEILLRQQQLRARLRKARDLADETVGRLAFTVSAEDAKEIVRRHQTLTREVGQVYQGIDASVIEMRLNRLGGEESLELIASTVVEPLHRMTESTIPEQRRAIEAFAAAPQSGNETVLEQQKQLVEEMDRILKNMAQWDSFIDVVNQLDAVIKLEQSVKRQTEDYKSKIEAEKKKKAESVFD